MADAMLVDTVMVDAVMVDTDVSDEIPNLSGLITLGSHRPAFDGQYSCVYYWRLVQQSVAIKVLKDIPGSETHTMQRVCDSRYL